MTRARNPILVCLGWLLALAPAVTVRADDSTFGNCRPSTAEGWTYEDLLCLSRTGRQHRQMDEARRRLRQLGAGDIERPWATLVLAHATVDSNESAALRLYERAAAGFLQTREADGEVIARQNLRNLYHLRGDLDAAWRQTNRAVEAAEASRDPLTIARAAVVLAAQTMETGGDIGAAHEALERAEHLAFPGAPIGLRRSILFNLASAALYLGRLEEAIAALERHRALRNEDGSPIDAALVAFNLLNARLTMAEARPLRGVRERLVAEAEAVLAEATQLNQPTVQAQTLRVLGELISSDDPVRAEDHLRRCLALEASFGYPGVRASCLWSLALRVSSRDPGRAERLSREAMSLIGADQGGPLLAYAWQSRLRLVWRTLPEDLAIAESLSALDAIERLRAGQQDDDNRASLFSNWTRDYSWLTGRLLEAQRLPLALDVGERLRSRELLEYLLRSGAPQGPDAGQTGPRRGAERTEVFASLRSIQESLQPDEAMLWFSIAPWKDLYDEFGGGAWVVSVTRDGATVHRLASGPDLDSQVMAFVGLLRRRDTAPDIAARAARHLGGLLLGRAAAALPNDIHRLVIVSDGVLHRLPFEALRIPTGALVGDRFDVTIVPSATIWQRLRQTRIAPAVHAALVLADPELPRHDVPGGARLEPLPWSRKEARAIARLLGLRAEHVVQGSAASERLLKTGAADGVPVLHIAAHARADAAAPERSAVFLAPGDAREDGWLRPGEIATLGLRGQLVVLSACDSADGPLLSGEGPLSLARAFFAGGAGGVVATRWPLRDDDAAFLMERFYEALAAGDQVAGALRRARRAAIGAGLPAAAWAGVAVIGDGSRQPYLPGRPASNRWPAVMVAVSLAAVGAGLSRTAIRARWRRLG